MKPARWGRAGFVLLGRRCCYEVRRQMMVERKPERIINARLAGGKCHAGRAGAATGPYARAATAIYSYS